MEKNKKNTGQRKIIFSSHRGDYFPLKGSETLSQKEAEEMDEAFRKMVAGIPQEVKEKWN